MADEPISAGSQLRLEPSDKQFDDLVQVDPEPGGIGRHAAASRMVTPAGSIVSIAYSAGRKQG